MCKYQPFLCNDWGLSGDSGHFRQFQDTLGNFRMQNPKKSTKQFTLTKKPDLLFLAFSVKKENHLKKQEVSFPKKNKALLAKERSKEFQKSKEKKIEERLRIARLT